MLHEQIIVQLPNVLVGTQPKGQLGTGLGDGLSFFGVRFGPVKLLLEVGKVLLDGNVVYVGFHLVVEKVLGQSFVMKEQPGHEELRQGSGPGGTTSPADVDLIPMLGMDGIIGKGGGNDVGMSVKEGPVDGGRFSPILFDGEPGIDPGEGYGFIIAFGGLVVLLLVLLLGIHLGLSLDGHGNGPPAGGEDVPILAKGVDDVLDGFKVLRGAAHDVDATGQLEVEGRKEASPIGTAPVDLGLEILPLGSGVVLELIEAGGDGTLAQNVALEAITGHARQVRGKGHGLDGIAQQRGILGDGAKVQLRGHVVHAGATVVAVLRQASSGGIIVRVEQDLKVGLTLNKSLGMVRTDCIDEKVYGTTIAKATVLAGLTVDVDLERAGLAIEEEDGIASAWEVVLLGVDDGGGGVGVDDGRVARRTSNNGDARILVVVNVVFGVDDVNLVQIGGGSLLNSLGRIGNGLKHSPTEMTCRHVIVVLVNVDMERYIGISQSQDGQKGARHEKYGRGGMISAPCRRGGSRALVEEVVNVDGLGFGRRIDHRPTAFEAEVARHFGMCWNCELGRKSEPKGLSCLVRVAGGWGRMRSLYCPPAEREPKKLETMARLVLLRVQKI